MTLRKGFNLNCKIDNVIVQRLITILPELLAYRAAGCSHKELYEIVKSKYNIVLKSDNPVAYIKGLIRPIRYNNLNPEFADFVIFRQARFDSSDFDSQFYITKHGMIFTKKIYLSENYNSELLSHNNVHLLPTNDDCLIGKRLLRLHDIHDNDILNLRWNLGHISNVYEENFEVFTPDNIHLHIMKIFADIRDEFRDLLFRSQIRKIW